MELEQQHKLTRIEIFAVPASGAIQSWQPSQFAMVQTALQNLQAILYPPVLSGKFQQENQKPKLLHLSVEQLPGASSLPPAWISLDTGWLVEHSVAYYSIL
ncbi:hypothetical protein [Paenibacillus sp. NPDC057934]|uniref:hypothetical protein n=1 Tax=Paenibacillus sp. NPDC057934 TaxID=3346282 RepID=UPI0036DB1F0D